MKKKRKVKINYKFIVFATILLIGIFTIITNYLQTPTKPSEIKMKACRTSSDCIVTPVFCCGCNEGGESTCINKNYQNEWRQQKCPDTVFCTQVYLCFDIPSCECVNQQCEIIYK